MSQISTLFANDITRRIEEVIKVDDTASEIIAGEIDEYVVTDSIKRHFLEVLESYQAAPLKPTDAIAVWVSGFFGSGKSSFAKLLGLTLGNPTVLGTPAARRFAEHVGDPKLDVVLKTINEKIPTHTVIFDVSTDRGIRSGNQMLTEIMYRLFLESLGYAKDIDLAELEIGLEQTNRLEAFEAAYRDLYNKEWREARGLLAFATNEASRVMHQLDATTYPAADSWAKSRAKPNITTGLLAERIVELMARRKPNHSLVFVVDEVGQFVARDVQKMLDLQAIVQQLGIKGRGKFWIIVTSQERLNELVSGLDGKQIELGRLMDRFPLQVHLEPSDISEVTSRRVLAKNGAAEGQLGKLFEEHRGRLQSHTTMTADVRLPELSREHFIDLYPLLPYQIDLIIDIVSGLRTQGGASRHVGGANRTIIKLAQQLLINPATQVAEAPVGRLVGLDQVYDLIESNIGSDIRGKIASIPARVGHPLALSVAKAVCLLQFVKTVHRTPENIAASLVDRIDGESKLAEVREALVELERGQFVRRGDDGYRIPTPSEDDWDKTRQGLDPRRADERQLFATALNEFWTPQPSFTLGDTKVFRAGLMIDGVEKVQGDITFHLSLADGTEAAAEEAEALRSRSQGEPKSVFWAVAIDDEIRREAREAWRSEEMIRRRAREAATAEETKLIAEEKARQRHHQHELRRRLKAACLAGKIYFRGNDRSPDGGASDIGKVAAKVLGQALPQVYDRFPEAGAKRADVVKGIEALLKAENLNGLPRVFAELALLKEENGVRVFRGEAGPLGEIATKIAERVRYGDQATGRYLEEEFARAPFGWEFDVIRLLTLSLVRAGAIEGSHRGQTLDSARSAAAEDCFNNNNYFRLASFRPRKGVDFGVVADTAEQFRETFGDDIPELNETVLAMHIRRRVEKEEQGIADALALVRTGRLPGADMLESALNDMRNIRAGGDENAILTFSASHKSIKDAIRRSADLTKAWSDGGYERVEAARKALAQLEILQREPDFDPKLAEDGRTLEDLLSRETFFRDLPQIDQAAKAITDEHERRRVDALRERAEAYSAALEQLVATPGWEQLEEAVRDEIAASLRKCADERGGDSIAQLRSDADACAWRLGQAIQRVLETIEGDRLATLSVGQFFVGGIESEEQLDQALAGLREELARLIGEGKKVIIR